MTNDELADMRERAESWLCEVKGGPLVITRDKAIGEESMALDVLDLIAEINRLQAERDAAGTELARIRPVYLAAKAYVRRPPVAQHVRMVVEADIERAIDAALAAEPKEQP